MENTYGKMVKAMASVSRSVGGHVTDW